MTPQEILDGLRQGNRRALSKAITLIESQTLEHRQQASWLIDQLEQNQESLRIAVSGPPGAGKSTFIEAFGMLLIERGHRVAVLAIDPSSSISHGSILGDKTRMTLLASHPQSFIRPSPSGETLGGVARKTREAILLCEFAGYDRIIVETVGVGQSETLASSMVDLFLILQLPNAGDDLQGIKKGILELADLVLINKADGKHKKDAERAYRDLKSALSLVFQRDQIPKILCCSALEKTGLDEVLQAIEDTIKERRQDSRFLARRQSQAIHWFDQTLKDEVLFKLQSDRNFDALVQKLRSEVHGLEKAPSAAVQDILGKFHISVAGS